MHLGDCLGGYNFFEKNYETTLSEPRFIDRGEVTANVFAPDSRILEINSKSGLYPLYMAYSIYRAKVKNSLFSVSSIEDEQRIWDKVVTENIFVICKTPMAKSITKRTLIGFRKAKVNTRYFEDLINQIKNDPEYFIKQVDKFITDKTGIKNMKINAIMGSPPYQIMDGGAGVSAKPVYNEFVNIARTLSPGYMSMIMLSRWYAGGKELDSFRDSILKDKHITSLFDYFDATDVFPRIDLSGGVCYFLWSANHNNDCAVTTSRNRIRNTLLRSLLENGADSFVRFNKTVNIMNKIPKEEQIFYTFVSPHKPFGIATDFKIDKSVTKGVELFAYPNNGWFEIAQIPVHKEWIGKYKVFISYAYGERRNFPYFSIGKPFYGFPMTCCSKTYLVIYPCDSEEEMKNVAWQ